MFLRNHTVFIAKSIAISRANYDSMLFMSSRTLSDANTNITLGPSIKDIRTFLAVSDTSYRNFDPHLPNFYLLISCNIGISDPPPKIFRHLLQMAPNNAEM